MAAKVSYDEIERLLLEEAEDVAATGSDDMEEVDGVMIPRRISVKEVASQNKRGSAEQLARLGTPRA